MGELENVDLVGFFVVVVWLVWFGCVGVDWLVVLW